MCPHADEARNGLERPLIAQLIPEPKRLFL